MDKSFVSSDTRLHSVHLVFNSPQFIQMTEFYLLWSLSMRSQFVFISQSSREHYIFIHHIVTKSREFHEIGP